MARAAIAFVALPGVVTFAAPLLLVWVSAPERPFHLIALPPLLAGIALLLWCVRECSVARRGTLAPRPPGHLITSGPYRASRNPMYIAVALVLAGWAMGFQSAALWLYAAAVMAAFHLRVVFAEEPALARTHRDDWERYASSVPRWLFPHRKAAVLTAGGAVAGLLMAGLIYEAYAEARDLREFPPPGTLVDVGGRRLHVLCIGEGEPTVFFESSGWGSSMSSPDARARIATRARVCSYDRRGQGWSDAAPGATSVAALASDLGVLQDRASLRGPFIVVAASIGGLTAEMFARQYPERVAGLVFVDAASSLSAPLVASRAAAVATRTCMAGVLAYFGVIRLLDPFQLGDDTEESRRAAALTYGAPPWNQACAMARGLRTSQEEFAQAPPFPADVPMIVLSASSAADRPSARMERFSHVETGDLPAHHQALAKQSTRGAWRMVPDSTHLIGDSQPQAVADAVLDVIDLLR